MKEQHSKTGKGYVMIDKMRDLWDNLIDYMPGVVAAIIILLVLALGFGLGFLILWFMAWVLMSVYNILAIQFGWPIFSQWFWLGVWLVIGWLKKTRKIVIKRREE